MYRYHVKMSNRGFAQLQTTTIPLKTPIPQLVQTRRPQKTFKDSFLSQQCSQMRLSLRLYGLMYRNKKMWSHNLMSKIRRQIRSLKACSSSCVKNQTLQRSWSEANRKGHSKVMKSSQEVQNTEESRRTERNGRYVSSLTKYLDQV